MTFPAGQVLLNSGERCPLLITHQDLAIELGTEREVVSRLLRELERKNRVRLARGRIDIL